MHEKMRSQIVAGMKVGYNSAIYFANLVTTCEPLKSLFGEQKWYDEERLFTPEKLKDREWYTKDLLTKEENKDNFGN